MTASSTPVSVIGQSVERIEDPPLVTGRGRFIGDVSFPHQLHMRMVRSNTAHGVLRSIDATAARALPGVIAVWTATDVAGLGPIDFREGPIEALAPYRQPLLAIDRVRYVGEPIAAVFAIDAYVAEDAADLVTADIDDLDPVVSASATPGEFAPGRSTEATVLRQSYGDVDGELARSYAVVEIDVQCGRHSGVPLETRGAVGRYDAARDVLELYGAAKVPHKNRESLARMLGLGTAQLHLYEGHTGGGFGIRGEIYPEDILVLVAARRLGRPVKWIEDRREHLIAANQSREQRHIVRMGVDRDGRITAIDSTFLHDQGGYIRTHATRVANMTGGILPGPYRVPAYSSKGHFRLTNKTPCATYRAPGRFEANLARERALDAAAHRLGIDRIEIRRRNLISVSEMPYARPLEVLGDETVIDTGDYEKLLDLALARFDWDETNAACARRRAAGELVGTGLAVVLEKSGLGPTDGVRVNVDTSGMVEVITGGASVGQGFETAMAQIAAEELGVDYRRVRVVHGRTDRIEYGVGAHASRATVMTGSATAIAAGKVRDKALGLAAVLLQTPADQLVITDGVIMVKDRAGGPSITLGEVAAKLSPTSPARGDRDPGLCSDGWFTTDHQVYPYGVHIAQVSIDPGTAAIKVERALVAYDVGRAVNPALIHGQILGGFVQGLGGALYEEFVYDERGQPLSTTLADYLLPGLHDSPPLVSIITEDAPTPRNPLGIKGAGESGIAGVGAIIASAIDDALQMPGGITQLPVTPSRLFALMSKRNESRD